MLGIGGVSVEELLTKSEGKTLEFKRDLSSLKPILRTVVAFANTAGGILIIGYSPEDGLIGLPDVLAAEESLSNTINDSIAPAIYPEIDVKSVNGQDLLIVSIPFIFRQHESLVPSDPYVDVPADIENGTINTENGTINTEIGTDYVALKYECYGLSSRQIKILHAIMCSEMVDVQTIVRELFIPRRTALRDLAYLKNLNIIQYIGSKKTGKYVLVEVAKET